MAGEKPVIGRDEYVAQLTRLGFWNDPARSIGYVFLESRPSYIPYTSSFTAFSAFQRAAAQRAFGLIAEVANLAFSQIQDNGQQPGPSNQRITFHAVSFDQQWSGSARAYQESGSLAIYGADIALNNFHIQRRIANESLFDFPSYVILHEILHAVGLSHPGDYNGPGFNYNDHASFRQDTRQYSVMSYWDASNTGADHIRDGTHYVGATPLLYDILALQKLYGANMATRTGDTVYGFNSNTGQSPFNFAVNPGPVIAIWDAGGNDTLDLSGYATPSRIDLNDGEFSDAGGMTMNIAIAFGAVIENAVGGAGDDVLIGNSANNVLTGGGGSDRLSGARGVDVLIGSAGADVFVFNATADSGIKALLACGPDKSIKNVVPDLLRDFVSGEDRIDLSIIDAVASSEGDDAFTYIGSAAFSGRAGELRFEFANGTVHIFGDVDGNGIADLHIITSGSTLQPGDFIL